MYRISPGFVPWLNIFHYISVEKLWNILTFAASNNTHLPPANVLKQTSWNSFDENIAQNQSAETLLNALKNVQQSMYVVYNSN